MKKNKKKRGRIDLGMRSSSGIGIVSSCLAGAEFFLFLAGVYLSYLKQGKAGWTVGLVAFAVFVLSVIGTVMGIYGLTREEYHHGPDIFGALANGAILVGICAMFVFGTLS